MLDQNLMDLKAGGAGAIATPVGERLHKMAEVYMAKKDLLRE